MGVQAVSEVTQLLRAWCGGDHAALDRLIPLVYSELHRQAHRFMRHEPAGHVLQTTALVNETYLKLIDANQVEWQNRALFFAISAKLMRQILVDFARSRRYKKRQAAITNNRIDINGGRCSQLQPLPVFLDTLQI